MPKYVSKPVVIEAEEFVGEPMTSFDSFVPSGGELMVWNDKQQTWLTARLGDYVISLSPEDRYVCPRDVFLAKYSPVVG